MAINNKQLDAKYGLTINGTEVIDASGNVKATALTVTNTATVTNLNADKLDGYHASSFPLLGSASTVTATWAFNNTTPFTVSSTSVVTNLNADTLDGYHASSFPLNSSNSTISSTWTFSAAPSFSYAGAPFTVSNTGKVTNLNADLLDGYHADTSATASTIALRDSNGDLSTLYLFCTQPSLSVAQAGRNSDTIFYSSVDNKIYKNTATGFKTSLALENVENTALSSYTIDGGTFPTRINTIKFTKTTRASLTTKASASGLLQGEPYYITDENIIAIGTGTSTSIDIPKGKATISTAAATVLDDATVGDMVNTLGGATSTGTGGLVRGGSPFLTGVVTLTKTTDNSVTFGPELAVTPTIGANWVESPAGTFTHSSGSIEPITFPNVEIGKAYHTTITMTWSAGTLTTSIGGFSCIPRGFGGTYTFSPFTATTAGFSMIPSTGFIGAISSISVKEITAGTTSSLTLATTSGSAMELRGSYNTNNVYLGINSGKLTTGGINNTAVGHKALESSTSGQYNTAYGAFSLGTCYSGTYNVAIGYTSLRYGVNANFNTIIGAQAAAGVSIGESMSNNTGVGYGCLQNCTGNYSVAIGAQTLKSNTADYNVAVGYFAGYANTSGEGNTYVGNNSGIGNNGKWNVYIGSNSGSSSTDAYQNVFIGKGCAPNITVGYNNTILGYATGLGITTGYENTIIGANVASLSASLHNNIIIADGGGNRRINVDSAGNVGISVNSPTAALHLKAGTATASSAPLKFTSGTLLTTPEAGALEYASNTFYIRGTDGLSVASTITAGATVRLKSYTVATLPTGIEGDIAYCTDLTSPTYNGTLTGGGSVRHLVFRNATVWVS